MHRVCAVTVLGWAACYQYRNTYSRCSNGTPTITTNNVSTRSFHMKTPLLLEQSSSHLKFSLEALPPPLQREFCCEENARDLKHLAAPLEKNETTCSDVLIKVLPSWAHVVLWRCSTCSCQWAARPVDRVDPQVSAFYACPNCSSASTTTTTTTNNNNNNNTISTSSSSSSSSLPHLRRFADVYPLLAAQWDGCRNAMLHNRVMFESVRDVPLPCSVDSWWLCPHCHSSWKESVDSRVHRYVQQTEKETKRAAILPLCPSCEKLGVHDSSTSHIETRITNTKRNSQKKLNSVEMKRFLKDDALLLAEAQLQPNEDPATLPLESNKLLHWRCRSCTHEFTASIADRYLRYYRCPQCSGAVGTPLNLLSIQRPDVCREVARTVSNSKVRRLTIHDDTVITFVCRTCMSPFRMSVRLRCLLPPGRSACPKCLWSRSERAKEMAAANMQRIASGASPMRQLKQHRLKRRNRDTIEVTLNELLRRDTNLMN
ncbi:uncharacterized protein TM35_000541240 [Trypanosoma theileri]|uniref:Treble clef zinc finger domain-containing protein n=1 Tax=Trypanosoma theileri TaxID=67003 RepID=A0A1X0NIH3_9TRYP|nr:uncharacterized protein TM35_000541240 [Trypanosoma theileri]ORC83900.1 hypothetical protein TM35_000541240 [Trypanosoma theileri]